MPIRTYTAAPSLRGEVLYVANNAQTMGQDGDPVWNEEVNTFSIGRTNPTRLATLRDGIVGPVQMFTDSRGMLYVLNTGAPSHGSVLVFPRNGVKAKIVISKHMSTPKAMTLSASGDLYVANFMSDTVTVYKSDSGALMRTITAGIDKPNSLAIDSNGTLYVANSDNVAVFRSGASKPTRILSGFTGLLALDGRGDLVVAGSRALRVYSTQTLVPKRKVTAGIDYPHAMAIDRTGRIYVASNLSILVFAPGATQKLLTISDGINVPVLSLVTDREDDLFATQIGQGLSSDGTVLVYRPGSSAVDRTVDDGVFGPDALAVGPR